MVKSLRTCRAAENCATRAANGPGTLFTVRHQPGQGSSGAGRHRDAAAPVPARASRFQRDPPLRFEVRFFEPFLDDFLRAGTFAPARRASESPIAMACLRLVTFLPERPERSVPLFISSMLRCTFLPAFLLVFLPAFLPERRELCFLRVAMSRPYSKARAGAERDSGAPSSQGAQRLTAGLTNLAEARRILGAVKLRRLVHQPSANDDEQQASYE
jgi:hypothetical protein